VNGDTKIGPYGNIQLSFSGLERLEEGQKGIAGFFSAKGTTSEKAVGKRLIKDEVEETGSSSKKRKVEEPNSAPPSPPPQTKEDEDQPSRVRGLPTYTCSRCSRTLSIPASSLPSIVAEEYSRSSIEEALKKVEEEERDYHLARDMVEEERKRAGWRTTSSASTETVKEESDKGKTKKKKTAGSASSSKGKEAKAEGGQRSLGSFFKK
jgi:DNA polymerase eta